MWVVDIRAQVFMFAEQTFYPLNHLLCPFVLFLNCTKEMLHKWQDKPKKDDFRKKLPYGFFDGIRKASLMRHPVISILLEITHDIDLFSKFANNSQKNPMELSLREFTWMGNKNAQIKCRLIQQVE